MSPRVGTNVVKILLASALLLVSGAAACGGSQESTTATATSWAIDTPTSTGASTSAADGLEPIVTPTLPADIPGYCELDPATGLHVTGTAQIVDLAEYRLKIRGKVGQELSLSYDELRRLPKVTATLTLTCPEYFDDRATWSGVPLHLILEMAGVQPEAEGLVLTSADNHAISIDLEDALQPENFLAYELEGEPLPVLHGFPLRAVLPDKYGAYWAKWLVEIDVQ